MIKLKFKDLDNENFSKVLVKLYQEPGWGDFKAAYNLAKILRRVDKELAVAREAHLKILEKFAEKDEAGKFVTTANKTFPFVIKDELEEEYKKQLNDFMDTEVEIDCHLIKGTDLDHAKLAPKDLASIEPILDLQF